MKSVDIPFFPLPEGITLQAVAVVKADVVVKVGCQYPGAACPQCQQLSRRVHSQYRRTVADLPCAGRRVVLHLTVRKFVCGTPSCPQQFFTERLATLGIVCPHDQSVACRRTSSRDAHWRREWRSFGISSGNTRVCPDTAAPDAPGGSAAPRTGMLGRDR